MKSNKLPSVVVLMILTLITILFLVAFNIYRVFSAKPAPVVSEEILKPINPTLDTKTLEIMSQKLYP